jgi:tRNA nucleotidyltransferase (CCA-adding enzyme)
MVKDIKMPENVKMILDKLSSEGHEAVIIGGCVRDSIMGIEPHDWDIATSAQPEEIMECFKHYNLMKAGLKHGTVTVIIDHEPYEITTYRIDGEYSDHRRPDSVDFTCELAEDIMRRDFTINAIAYDGENIIDLHDGIGDLQKGIIRCVGNANARFREDPLRILRAIRFAARFGFEIEESTKKAMFDNCDMLRLIATERRQSEFTKTLCSEHVSIIKDYAKILKYGLPCIDSIKDFDKAVRAIEMCQDISEKLAILIDGLSLSEYNKAVKAILTGMRYPNKVIVSVQNIFAAKKMVITNSDACIKNMLYKFSLEDVKHILRYKHAKINASDNINKETLEKVEDMIERAEELAESDECYNLKGLAINGNDLKRLGVKDLDIKWMLDGLLKLVTTNQVENLRDVLIEVAKISML